MQIIPPALERLIQSLNKLPGVGKKTATRLALHVLRRPAGEARNLAGELAGLHDAIQLCRHCFIFSESDPCVICSNPKRQQDQICIVEEPSDLMSIEKTGAFQGVYHVLHGTLSPMDGIGPDEIKIEELIKRIRTNKISEVLIATSSTVPGEATAAYLTRTLQPEKVKITRLACGIPMGMEIKYADEITLSKSIQDRNITS